METKPDATVGNEEGVGTVRASEIENSATVGSLIQRKCSGAANKKLDWRDGETAHPGKLLVGGMPICMDAGGVRVGQRA